MERPIKKYESNFFEIVEWNMIQYFGYSQEDSKNIISEFKKEQNKKGDGFYFRYGAYHTASMIFHYSNITDSSWFSWRDKNNYKIPPEESINYYNAHYTSKEIK
jgi:hypothetical protein